MMHQRGLNSRINTEPEKLPEIEAIRDISHLIHFTLKSSAVQKIENRLAADYLNRSQCIPPLNE